VRSCRKNPHGDNRPSSESVAVDQVARTAPDCTQTSQPALTSLLATSGTRATRRSPGRVSVVTANLWLLELI
jgi:hypothetical protein